MVCLKKKQKMYLPLLTVMLSLIYSSIDPESTPDSHFYLLLMCQVLFKLKVSTLAESKAFNCDDYKQL